MGTLAPAGGRPDSGTTVRTSVRDQALPAGLATVTAGLLLWHVTRPSLWVDEGASITGARRSWSHLWVLLQGNDAPLVPYYALLKLFGPLIDPLARGGHVELAFRLPSVLALFVATWVLAAWLRRAHSSWLAVTGTVVLAVTAGWSRYGQEARPYAVTALFAVLATVAWWRLAEPDGQARGRVTTRIGLYAVSVAGLIAFHAVAFLLVGAHLAAALLRPAERRRATLTRTLTGAAGGLLLTAPFLPLALHGKGATRVPDLSVSAVVDQLVTLLTYGDPVRQSVIPMLALIGAAQALPNRRAGDSTTDSTSALDSATDLARLALCWAVLPVLAWAALVVVRPTMLVHRYILFALPGWTVLAGLGLLTCVTAVATRFRPAALGDAVDLVAPVTVAVLAVALVWVQLPTLRAVRAPDGHQGDFRSAMRASLTPANRHLPLFVANSALASELVLAYQPGAADRVIGRRAQSSGKQIGSRRESGGQVQRELATAPRVGLLMWRAAGPNCPHLEEKLQDYANRCLPPALGQAGYRATSATGERDGWLFAVLQRPT